MGTEAFYTTAAQVMPALVIAFGVEVAFVLQYLQHQRARAKQAGKQDLVAEADTSQEWMVMVAIGLAIVFIVGEVLAFLALGFGWFNVGMFIPIGICLLLMIGATLYVPILRVTLTATWDED
ncbi:hypothetical protein [Nonomuraea jiangxiensis]|uniref:Uncharacterized protein n=1 Tax=Nonomuraea jiangxiensis TaxID=633440 RepID=A0A1G9JIY7_9ACTN|nr:hypothetical protein [Nonomuraea jiangxiensis]SDL37557.1 hypothetical protein SAMN05421869_12560 [Nonomuraea jiangxiensis]